MSAQLCADKVFRYRSFHIDKSQPLGHGSYGAVYKAKCDQLPCAAKVLHPTILDPLDPGAGKIMERFEQECAFLESIRHPNIVQYLGISRDAESGLPVLLMELLDESLTKMLERSPKALAYFVEVDICHDIALAVAYLHSNDIIHRDLSSNNVLMVAKRRAKVTDFGMSRISGAAPSMTPLTLCPGTLAYMSPEALKDPPTYTKKLDCFSEGVMMIQVCTRLWPDPGPRTKTVPFAASPTGMTDVPVLERERRKKHIDKIDGSHGLLPIAMDCLHYQENERPSSEELCERLAGLKESRVYRESREQVEREQNDIAELKGQIEIIEATVQQLREEILSKEEQLQTAERENQEHVEREGHLRSRIEQLNIRDCERERNRPERGSGRSSHSRSSSAHFQSTTFSSDVIPDGSSTLPRAMSRSSDRRGSGAARSTAPTNPESTSLCSLDELRYEDSESNMAFSAGRISITKKTKKNPRKDLAHLTVDNTEPLVEGETSLLVRTGSDGCLHQHNNSNDQDRFNGLEVGPQLGLFKSSSLESLHNDSRNRSTRHSFKKAVDRTIDGQAADGGEGGEQRGVDVDFDLEHTDSSPAVISYTKKPKKKGFSLKKVFKRKGSKKEKSPKSRGSKTQSMHVDLESIQSSLTPAEQELLTRYQLNVRQHPELHSQESVPVSPTCSTLSFQASASLDDVEEDEGEDSEYGNIHIVELHKGEEPLGIYLTHYTSPDGVDLGVFIGRMDENGFAFKSGEMQCNDRILACNGVDFTKEHTTQQVKDIFYRMAQKPLLRMAISRGVSLPEGDPDDSRDGEGHVTSEVGGAREDVEARRERGVGVSMATLAASSVGGVDVVGGAKDGGRRGESAPEPPGSPRILPPANLVVSRQEAVEEQEQDTDHLSTQNSHPSHQPETISKTVLTLDISLYNSTAAWLGITVYGKSPTAKKAGDMGIYIKSITPGGAAAMDGRLQKNDQILYVNRQNLTGKSNQEALDILRKALSSANDNNSKIRLVVARTINSGGSGRPTMAVLGERPEEV